LYLGLLMKKADPAHRVTVLERNPPDATYGWGVVFSEETLGALRDADRPSYEEITASFAKWNAIDVRYRGETVRSGGHLFAAIGRKRLLNVLQRRCAELGVELRFEVEVEDPSEFGQADLVVGADGVNSGVRARFAGSFRPALDAHSTRFVWFGTDLVFKAFTFIFRESEHGLFQVHGYPFDARTSTFIVECPEAVWRSAGLDGASEEESIRFCEKLFADDLAGHSLLSNRSLWVSFITVKNESWRHENVVLLGDAAHTAHFTIGSGTKLAMEDAVALADALARHPDDLRAALTEYEMERQPVIERFQHAAQESASYFEGVSRYGRFEPVQFAFNLLTRSGRITHLELQKRDPRFVARVDSWFGGGTREASPLLVAPPPLLAPLRIRSNEVSNRVALSLTAGDTAVDGVVGPGHLDQLDEAVHTGVGLVVTEMVAISAEGRITPGTPGLYGEGHVEAWREAVEATRRQGETIHRRGETGLLAVQLGHAGARASTRPRREGVERPLRHGNWPLMSASAARYTPRSQVPKAMTPDDMAEVTERFARSARMAEDAGFDLILLNFAHGYLISSFISPLTNRRKDDYGGSLLMRMRFPLEVFDAVRAAWPENRAVAVAISATDWVPGRSDVDDAVAVARMLKEHGCDLIQVLAGQTTVRARPDYRRLFLVPFSDRIRNEAGVPTLVGGNITTRDEVNTILAAGRADLCILDRGPGASSAG
jgi:anthraniloyl-CoA monooxygenase